MKKRTISLVLVICMMLTLVPAVVSDGLASTYSIDTFVGIAGAVGDYIDQAGTFPTSVVYNGVSYSIEKNNFYGLALACIKSIYEGTTTGNITKVTGHTTSNITGYTDTFNHVSVSKDVYMNTVTRNINWMQTDSSFEDGYRYFAAYVTYPSSGYTSYTGNFSFTRCLCTYARVLRYYRDNNVLPEYVDCTDLRTKIIEDGIYKISNMVASSKTLKMSTVTEPCEVTMETDADTSEQHWMFVRQSDGWYKIYTLHNWASQGRKLLKLSSLNSEATVMSEGTGSDNFLFKLYSPTPGCYWLISKGSQLVNGIMQYNATANTVTASNVVWSSGAQRWTITPVSNLLTDGAAYNISSAYTGDYIGINMEDMVNGTNPAELEMFYDPDSCSQQWKLTKQSNGWYTFTNTYSGYTNNRYLHLDNQGILEIATATAPLANEYLFMPYKLPNTTGRYNIICKADVDANLSLKLHNELGDDQYKIVYSTPYGDTVFEKWYIESVVPVTGISISSEEMVEIGDTKALTATVSPSNAFSSAVTWSSADTSIATVTQQGVVTGVSTGTTDITVTSNADPDIYETCSVRVGNYFATVNSYYDKGFAARYASFGFPGTKLKTDLMEPISLEFAEAFGVNIKNNVTAITSLTDECMLSSNPVLTKEIVEAAVMADCTHTPRCNSWTQSCWDFINNSGYVDSTTNDISVLFTAHNLFDDNGALCNRSFQLGAWVLCVQNIHTSNLYEKLLPSMWHELSHAFGARDHYHDGPEDVQCDRHPYCSKCGTDELKRPYECLMQTTKLYEVSDDIWCAGCRQEILNKLNDYFALDSE